MADSAFSQALLLKTANIDKNTQCHARPAYSKLYAWVESTARDTQAKERGRSVASHLANSILESDTDTKAKKRSKSIARRFGNALRSLMKPASKSSAGEKIVPVSDDDGISTQCSSELSSPRSTQLDANEAEAAGEQESISALSQSDALSVQTTPAQCCNSTLSSRRGIAVSLESTDIESAPESLSPSSRRCTSPFRGTSRSPSHPCSFPDSVSSRLTTGTQDEYAEPWQTIIFLDFDDTLFPTTWLHEKGLLRNVDRFEAPTDFATLAELERVDQAACDALAAASQLSSRICIVTNAQAPWVLNSTQIFMPRLHSVLRGPSAPGIVYARDKLHQRRQAGFCTESAYRDNLELREFLTRAKTVAMKAEVKAFYSQYPQQSWKNLISIGDGSYEHDAIQEITFLHMQPSHKKLRTKAIKLPDSPTCSEVERHLQTLKMYLSAIVQFNDDLDVDFGMEGGEKGLAEALQLPVTPMSSASPRKLPAMCPELDQIYEDHIQGA